MYACIIDCRGRKSHHLLIRKCEETNARQQLLDHLGYDAASIAQAAAAYSDDLSNGVSSLSIEDTPKPNSQNMSKAAEAMVKKALLVGNFEAAVECCFRTGNLADALVLASCGGADLWAKTQERYFKAESAKRPFLSIVSAIIHSQVRCRQHDNYHLGGVSSTYHVLFESF